MNIKLGSTVRDVVSGFTGIAIQRLDQLNGNVQIGIQPKMAEGTNTYPDAMFIDHHMLDVMDEGVVGRTTEAPEVAIKVGQRVKDRVSGLQGIATQKATYMNGCVSFLVVPALECTDIGQTAPESNWIDFTRLQVLGDGLLEIAAVTPPAENGKRPGGPAQRVTHR